MYAGLHGMYNYTVEYGITEDEADDYGHNMSIEVMESYSCIMDDIQSNAEESVERDTIDENEYEDLICSAVAELEEENAEWTLYRLRDNLTEEDKKHIRTLDWEEIRDLYGVD